MLGVRRASCFIYTWLEWDLLPSELSVHFFHTNESEEDLLEGRKKEESTLSTIVLSAVPFILASSGYYR